MARKSAPRPLRIGIALVAWVAAAAVAQGVLGADIGEAMQHLERAIEQRLEGPTATPPGPPPARSREEESIEPWELVSV
jgi:hypothetical protein